MPSLNKATFITEWDKYLVWQEGSAILVSQEELEGCCCGDDPDYEWYCIYKICNNGKLIRWPVGSPYTPPDGWISDGPYSTKAEALLACAGHSKCQTLDLPSKGSSGSEDCNNPDYYDSGTEFVNCGTITQTLVFTGNADDLLAVSGTEGGPWSLKTPEGKPTDPCDSDSWGGGCVILGSVAPGDSLWVTIASVNPNMIGGSGDVCWCDPETESCCGCNTCDDTQETITVNIPAGSGSLSCVSFMTCPDTGDPAWMSATCSWGAASYTLTKGDVCTWFFEGEIAWSYTNNVKYYREDTCVNECYSNTDTGTTVYIVASLTFDGTNYVNARTQTAICIQTSVGYKECDGGPTGTYDNGDVLS